MVSKDVTGAPRNQEWQKVGSPVVRHTTRCLPSLGGRSTCSLYFREDLASLRGRWGYKYTLTQGFSYCLGITPHRCVLICKHTQQAPHLSLFPWSADCWEFSKLKSPCWFYLFLVWVLTRTWGTLIQIGRLRHSDETGFLYLILGMLKSLQDRRISFYLKNA